MHALQGSASGTPYKNPKGELSSSRGGLPHVRPSIASGYERHDIWMRTAINGQRLAHMAPVLVFICGTWRDRRLLCPIVKTTRHVNHLVAYAAFNQVIAAGNGCLRVYLDLELRARQIRLGKVEQDRMC